LKPSILRGALVGAGWVSQFHLEGWRQIPKAEIIAIVDPDFQRAAERALEFDVAAANVYASLDELLEKGLELDFVDLAVNPEVRLDLVQIAAGAGLDIICQKPMAPTLQDARTMIDLCAAANVRLLVHENWRWRTWYRQIKTHLDEGRIGRTVYARIYSHSGGYITRRFEPGHRYVGRDHLVLFEVGIHYLDIMRFLFGEPLSVYAIQTHEHQQLAGETHIVVMLTWPQERIGIVDLSWSSFDVGHNERRTRTNIEDVRIEGDEGAITLFNDPVKGDRIRIVSGDTSTELPAYEGEPIEAYQRSYTAAQQNLIDDLLGRESAETSASENYQTLKLMLAAYESAETNKVVYLETFEATPDG
jgi:predicted dehydrogenase